MLTAYSCQTETESTSKDAIPKDTLFNLLDPDSTGIEFTNKVIEKPERSYYVYNTIYNGGGVALGDVNNDGLLDLLFTGNDVPNQLYLNKGNLKFENISEQTGIDKSRGWHNGASMIDINNDGLLDIYICKSGYRNTAEERKNLLYINEGDLNFREAAEEFGLADTGYSYHVSFFDYDGDSDLDMFVINHPDRSFLNIPAYKIGEMQGAWDCKDHLYENDNGYFKDVTREAGLDKNYGFGLSLVTADMNEDGLTDIFVANDYKQRDYLWLSNGDGSFRDGLEDAFMHISLFSMGSDYADINNDGKEDLFVAEMLPSDYKRSKTSMANMSTSNFYSMVRNGMHYQYMHNVMQLNRGNGKYSEIAQMGGIAKTDWSWSCFLSDFDNDGLRDLFVSNGYRRDVYDRDSEKLRDEYFKKTGGKIEDTEEFFKLIPATKLKNNIFKNTGDLHFEKKMKEWGFEKTSFSNGASVGDLDNDGDLDIVVNNLEDKAFVYENTANTKENNSIRIKLLGQEKNQAGIGAKVIVNSTSIGQQSFVQKITRGFLASADPTIHFGMGQDKQADIKVIWPDGRISNMNAVSAGSIVEIDYKSAIEAEQNLATTDALYVDKTSEYLGRIMHNENEFDDFHSQILLPHRLSRLGPFTSVADINNDGLEDFFIGGASGQAGSIFVQMPNGKFSKTQQSSLDSDAVFEDMESVFFDCDGDLDLDLYVVSGGTEKKEGDPYYQDRLYINDGSANFVKSRAALPPIKSSGKSVACLDFDNDGDLDLIVGGRTIPDKYPQTPDSYLLENQNGRFKDVTESNASDLRKAGMINSIAVYDINSDGYEDIIVAGEWMPISIFINKNGQFKNQTAAFGLSNTSGWWNQVSVHDLNNDGLKDIIAGNLGKNYKFKASESEPFKVYSSDFDNNGSYDILLAKYYDGTQVPVRGRQCTSEQMPFIAEKFPSYEAFAEASLNQIVEIKDNNVLENQAVEFSSMVFYQNTNGGFNAEPLPVEAQISTINDIAIIQKPGETARIMLVGNMFDSEVETTRADASIGLVLELNSQKQLKALSSEQSGVYLPYNVKDVKAIRIESSDCFLITSNDDALRCLCRNI